MDLPCPIKAVINKSINKATIMFDQEVEAFNAVSCWQGLAMVKLYATCFRTRPIKAIERTSPEWSRRSRLLMPVLASCLQSLYFYI